jgi:hypothetical protein
MSGSKIARRGALIASILAAMTAVALPLSSQAASPTSDSSKPKVTTGKATHILATSALLTAAVNPNGSETSYYFQYGTTTTYGSQTPTVNIGSGKSRVKVGQSISKLQTGVTYHFRVVATTTAGSFPGADRTFIAGKSATGFGLPKTAEVVVGTPFVLSGTLSGSGGVSHALVLQGTSYPYQEAFKPIGVPGSTDTAGRFSFPVPSIATSTEFRVVTLDTRPVYSRTETVHAQVRVALHARSSKIPGLVRLYGTVSPATVGAPVLLEVHTAIKAGKGKPGSEATAKFVQQFTTVVKKGGKTFSRFSAVVNVRVGGRYRAVIKLPRTGPVVSGFSQTVVLHAPPATVRKSAKKTKAG